MKHYQLEISQFVDNELPADELKKLFVHLSDCEECRGILSDFMGMKKGSKAFYDDIDVDLKPAIKLPAEIVPRKVKNTYKTLFYFSAAASIILGLLFLIKLSNVDNLETQYSSLQLKYNELRIEHSSSKKDDIINNSSSKNISSNDEKVSSEKKHHDFKKSDYVSTKNLSSKSLKENYSKFSGKSQQITVVQVTKNDFLTPQIIGN